MLVFTRSKINLGLDITSRRSDGYHEISTVLYPIEWGDVLEIVPARGSETTLTVSGRPVDCPVEKNLVMRAYRALSSHMPGGLPPVDIYLRKIVPDGAGLGGGSADAAYTLRVLRDMFGLAVSDRDLADIAATLGADCPFFVYDTPMLASGTGTTLSPIALPEVGHYTIIVVKPPESVSTAEAYAHVTPYQPAEPLERRLEAPIEDWRELVTNAFEASVLESHRLIGEVKRTMYDAGAVYVAMSGSGSAVFGLFNKGAQPELPTEWQSAPWSLWCSDAK